MRVVSEYLYKTDQLLIRLLGTTTPVQTGAYIIDGTPKFPIPFPIDVSDDQIVNGEVDLSFSGFNLKPAYLTVTLPDTTVQHVTTKTVEVPTPTSLASQSEETNVPDEPPMHQPIMPEIEVVAPPVLPPHWCELNFAKTNPLLLGMGCNGSLTYTGGCAGRALDAKTAQKAQDAAPYLIGAPFHLEGTFENVIPNDTLYDQQSLVGFLDTIPAGWGIQLADPNAMLRVETQMVGLLPTILITYYKTPGEMTTSTPAVTISTPVIPDGYEFSALFDPARENASGTITLVSEDGLVASPITLLPGLTPLNLNVGTHGGQVKIVWNQSYGDGEAQVLRIACPTSTQYSGVHTWTPAGRTSQADILTADISFVSPAFKFDCGSLKIDSSSESGIKPISWALSVPGNLLSLTSGILASAYSSSVPLDLVPYLTSLPQSGSYSLKWSPGKNLTLYGKGMTIQLPFIIDLPIPPTTAAQLVFNSFGPNEGSGRLQYVAFSPM